jgi:hypothetical protein
MGRRTMNVDPNWLSAIANVVVAISIVFIGMQVRISIETLNELKAQRNSDHDRSRRENAVALLQEWIGHNTNGEPSARFIVEKFSPEECQKMLTLTPFYVPADRERKLRNALYEIPSVFIPPVDKINGILLSEDLLFQLGRLCHNYLSSLEVILIAWRNHTADPDILEQQLSFVVKPTLNFYCLKNFREAMGGGSMHIPIFTTLWTV